MNYTEYANYMTERAKVISLNRSRRMVRPQLEPLPVPPKINPPLVRIAYDKNGDYIGRLSDNDIVQRGWNIKLEPAQW
jgi:hypothetical protein